MNNLNIESLTMNKSDLVRLLHLQYPEYPMAFFDKAIKILTEEISLALSNGNRVELRGFGIFTTRFTKERQGFNPRTQQPMFISSKYMPYFKPGKIFNQRVNFNEEELSIR